MPLYRSRPENCLLVLPMAGLPMDPAVLRYLRNPPESQIATAQLDKALVRATEEGKGVLLHFGDKCWGW